MTRLMASKVSNGVKRMNDMRIGGEKGSGSLRRWVWGHDKRKIQRGESAGKRSE